MGVSFFREAAPDDFATFDLSFYAMSVLFDQLFDQPLTSLTSQFDRLERRTRLISVSNFV